MQNVTVRFISESMSVVSLLKQLSIKNGGIKKGVREYLRKKGNNIHYLDFLLLKELHPKLFEYYTFTFYKYSNECESYYSNVNLINSLSQYEQLFNFHAHLKPSTKHFFIGHSESAKLLIGLIKKNFEDNSTKILQSFIQYARENKPELYFFYFLSTLFLISIANEYETINKKHIVRLKIFPLKSARPSPKSAQKIEIITLDPVNLAKITEIICTNQISGLYFMTKHRNKYKRVIEVVKNILVINFIEVSDYRIINGPYQYIDFDLNGKNIVLVFEDSKSFFDRMSYKNNVGILIKSK